MPKSYTDSPTCFCGSGMVLRDGPYGEYYACRRRPECSGLATVGRSGRPRPVTDQATRDARKMAHALFDQLWSRKDEYGEYAPGTTSRSQAYEWMQMVMGLPEKEAHIHRFDVDECQRLIGEVIRECRVRGLRIRIE